MSSDKLTLRAMLHTAEHLQTLLHHETLGAAKDSAGALSAMLRQAIAAHEAEKQATLTIEAPNGDKIVAHGSAVDMMTLERIVKAAAEKQAGPVAGWKLVPVEPTEAMLRALSGFDFSALFNPEKSSLRAGAWRAMLAAAPSAPPSESDKEDAESALQWLYEEGCDLRSEARSDDDYGYVVVEHYMAKPHERVIGRGDKPLDAIRAARAKKEQP